MKKIITFLLSLSMLFACVFAANGCAKDEKTTIELKQYNYAFDIHTELQQFYLDYKFNAEYEPNEETDEVKGTSELSRPMPVTLEWTDSDKSREYVVEISENQDFSDAISVTVKEKKAEIYNLKIATEYFWRVKGEVATSETGKFSVEGNAPRNLYVDGVTNFRDFGGYMTNTGKRTKQGVLFRSARLNKSYAEGKESTYTEPDEVIPEITEKGLVQFRALGIKTEVDFRLDARNGYPEGVEVKSVVDGVNYVALPMRGNANLDGENGQQIKKLMELIADTNSFPIVYHCNIGTDRTGLVSYLLGGLCGVSEDDLLKDYLFSNFANIGELKSPSNSKNKFFGMNGYEGETLQKRIVSYFKSLGLSEQTINAVKDNLIEK